MRKRGTLLSILAIVIGSLMIHRLIQIRIDKTKIESLSEYKEAAKVLLENFSEMERIDKNRSSNEYKYKYGEPPFTILSTGEYYFKNTIMEQSKADLSKVHDLWGKNLVDGEFHSIKMTSDSNIIFKVKEIENFSSWVDHFLVYGQKQYIDELVTEYSFNRTYRIDDNWVYVSERNYKLVELVSR